MSYTDYFSMMKQVAAGQVKVGGTAVGTPVNTSESNAKQYANSRHNIQEFFRANITGGKPSVDKSMLYTQKNENVFNSDYAQTEPDFFSQYTVTAGSTLWDAAEAETMKNLVRLSLTTNYNVHYKDGQFIAVSDTTSSASDGLLIDEVDDFDTIDLDSTKNFQRMVIDVVAQGRTDGLDKQWQAHNIIDVTNTLGQDNVTDAIASELTEFAKA